MVLLLPAAVEQVELLLAAVQPVAAAEQAELRLAAAVRPVAAVEQNELLLAEPVGQDELLPVEGQSVSAQGCSVSKAIEAFADPVRAAGPVLRVVARQDSQAVPTCFAAAELGPERASR